MIADKTDGAPDPDSVTVVDIDPPVNNSDKYPVILIKENYSNSMEVTAKNKNNNNNNNKYNDNHDKNTKKSDEAEESTILYDLTDGISNDALTTWVGAEYTGVDAKTE